ncbi:MAG: hypothetical protein ACLPKI_23060 [Streptosporangiaceae bacterium]
MKARQLTKDQILTLPPVITLATLGECLGVSEPTIRACHRSGELERLGIKINRLGLQWRVITATVWQYLGLPESATTAPAPHVGNGQGKPAGPPLREMAQRGPDCGTGARKHSSGA